MRLPAARACVAPRDAPRHDGLAIVIEGRERMQCIERLGRENVRVACACVLTNLQHGARLSLSVAKDCESASGAMAHALRSMTRLDADYTAQTDAAG